MYNSASRRWGPVSHQPRHNKNVSPERLSLVSWNIDAFSSRPVARANLILDHVINGQATHPDVVLLQEVTSEVRRTLLNDARIRSAFLATDAEDESPFQGVPFASMMLLSRSRFASEGDTLVPANVFRVPFPSKYGRDALCADIARNNTSFRLVNVHLDSLWDTFHHREKQVELVAGLLREPGCIGGIVAGDFNAISPKDDELLGNNGLVDAWLSLGHSDGSAWGAGRAGSRGKRLDKIATLGPIKVEEMEIVRPGTIEVPRPAASSIFIPWSDHCGVRCAFTL